MAAALRSRCVAALPVVGIRWIRPQAFVAGNSVSLVSLLLLLVACSEPKWARDHVNSVDIGLWYLTVRAFAWFSVRVAK